MAFFIRKNTSNSLREKQDLYKKIHQLMQLSKYDRALPILESLMEQTNTLSANELDIIYQYYGECLVQSRRYYEAVQILSRGLTIGNKQKNRCRETLKELAIPAVEKQIIETPSVEEAFQLLECLETVATEYSVDQTIEVFLKRASEAYRLRDYQKALEAYDYILPFAEKHGCLCFEDIIRAGDCSIKCGQLNKAWKILETARDYSKTFHQTCRLHKKIADLLVIRNQHWHAILHFLVALQSVPSDKGARTKLQKVLRNLGLENHINTFLQLIAKHSDHRQLEISLMSLKKELKVV